MSFGAIDLIADLYYQLLGDGLIMSLVIIGFFVIFLFAVRANLAAILMVIIPLVLTFTLAPKVNDMIAIEPWIFYALLLGFGVIAGFVILINVFKN